jgi:hypothetical protein
MNTYEVQLRLLRVNQHLRGTSTPTILTNKTFRRSESTTPEPNTLMYVSYNCFFVTSYRSVRSGIKVNSLIRIRHCGENSRIFRDAADQTLPVTEYSEIDNLISFFSYIFRKIQLQVTFGLLHLGKSGSFCHSGAKMVWIRDTAPYIRNYCLLL